MLKANPQRMPLPAILLSKVRSPEDKLDNLMLDFTSKQEVTGCCAISLIETRLKPSVPDDAVSMEGLTTFWLDRSCSLNGKSRDGGVCIYINNNWWNNVKLVCSPDIEPLTVKCRPFYLPWEFTVIIFIAVFIPPSANTRKALNVVYHSISELQSTHPGGVFTVVGDFNQANMKTVFPHFHQYVDFATRGESTLDMAHSNIKKAFRAAPRPHLSSSDHLSVMLISAYKPLLISKKKKQHSEAGECWSAGAMEALQD